MDLAGLKAKLADIAGIEGLTETIIGGRRVYGFDGLLAAVDINSDQAAVEAAIRNGVALRAERVDGVGLAAVAGGLDLAPFPPQPKGKPMSTPAPGSFAASIRAMMDEARDGVARARADGLTQVRDAVGKLHEAKDATIHVAGQMAATIEDEAASVMSELGQISNDLGGEGS